MDVVEGAEGGVGSSSILVVSLNRLYLFNTRIRTRRTEPGDDCSAGGMRARHYRYDVFVLVQVTLSMSVQRPPIWSAQQV